MQLIETNQPLVQSQLWQIIRNYYIFKGPSAWTSEETPSFVTNSCYTANYYAQIIIHALKDFQGQYQEDETPFYILELSSGLGELAFYILSRLEILKKQYQIKDIKYCYILSDVVSQNIDAWQSCEKFKPFLTEKTIDFAYYDINHPEFLELQQQGIRLDKDRLTKPLIVIANYLFDSIPCDVYKTSNSKLLQGMTSLKIPDDFDIEKPHDLKDLELQIKYQEIATENVYPEPIYNQLLQFYQSNLSSAIFMLPVAALNYLNFWVKNSSGKLLLLVADKGYSKLEMMQDLDSFHLNYHASLSTLVNFHALEQFFQHQKGEGFYQDRFTSLTSVIYGAGVLFKDLPQLQNFLQLYSVEMSLQEYCRLLYQLAYLPNLDAITMLALFRLSKNDPIVLRLFYRQIANITNPRKLSFNKELNHIIEKIRENIYPLSVPEQMNYWLGSIYFAMGEYHQALEFLKQFKPSEVLIYEYLQKLVECYLQTNQEDEVRKLLPKIKKARNQLRLKSLIKKLIDLKILMRRGLRLLLLILAIAIFIYVIFRNKML